MIFQPLYGMVKFIALQDDQSKYTPSIYLSQQSNLRCMGLKSSLANEFRKCLGQHEMLDPSGVPAFPKATQKAEYLPSTCPSKAIVTWEFARCRDETRICVLVGGVLSEGVSGIAKGFWK